MYSFLRAALVVSCVTVAPVAAGADTILVGDSVRFLGSDGTPAVGGGAFHVDNLSNGAGEDFVTFCLQRSQYIDYSSTFVVGALTDYADDAAGPDYLSNETRWIYKNFRAGALLGYSSDETQAAIWTLEDEGYHAVGNSGSLVALAQLAIASGQTADGVTVLNLFKADGSRAQDQLALTTVPEPASLALLGTGLLAAVARWRRSRK